jgi:hypothetical protein
MYAKGTMSQEMKEEIATGFRLAIKTTNADAAACVTENWLRSAETGEIVEEALMLIYESRAGKQYYALNSIIRTPGGVDLVGWKVEDAPVTGRFVNLF